ncbi:hypothetical protein Tco_0832961 [Tanacetum coccineum]
MADDQPMWGNNRALTTTLRSAIIAVDLGEHFTIKGHHLSMIKHCQFDGRFTQHPNESLVDAWLRMTDLLRNCYEHGLSKGTIIQIFYHGLDEATQAILDAGGNFLYKTPNKAHQLLEDRVLSKLDWSKDIKTKPLRKTVAFAEGISNSQLMEKMEALTIKIDSQFKEIKREMKEMRDGCNSCGGPHPSTECDDKPIRGSKEEEANYAYRGYRERQKNHQAAIQDLETKFGHLSDQCSTRATGSLLSNTQTNPKPTPSNDKPYRPPPAQNEHVNVIFTHSGKTYDPPANLNATTIINDDDEKEEEPSSPKQTKTDPPPLKAYKPKIPYPQCLRKENMVERYAKFIDLIKEVKINVPLIDVLAGML